MLLWQISKTLCQSLFDGSVLKSVLGSFESFWARRLGMCTMKTLTFLLVQAVLRTKFNL